MGQTRLSVSDRSCCPDIFLSIGHRSGRCPSKDENPDRNGIAGVSADLAPARIFDFSFAAAAAKELAGRK